jgi:hypothetical protein
MNEMTEMTDTQKIQFLLEQLQATAILSHCDPENSDYSPSDSGSYDDAFEDGEEYGRVEYARYLLRLLEKQA